MGCVAYQWDFEGTWTGNSAKEEESTGLTLTLVSCSAGPIWLLLCQEIHTKNDATGDADASREMETKNSIREVKLKFRVGPSGGRQPL